VVAVFLVIDFNWGHLVFRHLKVFLLGRCESPRRKEAISPNVKGFITELLSPRGVINTGVVRPIESRMLLETNGQDVRVGHVGH